MKKKILLFGSIATVFAVGIVTVVASGIGQLDKLVATPKYTEHTIKLTKDNVVLDFEDSGSAYFGFYKETATLSGDGFKTNTNQSKYSSFSSKYSGNIARRNNCKWNT